jgi:hypothetical protein
MLSCSDRRRDVGRRGSLRTVVGVKAVPLTSESFDDHLDILPRPPGHLVADELRFLEKAGLADPAAQLTQLMPNLITLPRTVTVKPIRRRHHVDDCAALSCQHTPPGPRAAVEGRRWKVDRTCRDRDVRASRGPGPGSWLAAEEVSFGQQHDDSPTPH